MKYYNIDEFLHTFHFFIKKTFCIPNVEMLYLSYDKNVRDGIAERQAIFDFAFKEYCQYLYYQRKIYKIDELFSPAYPSIADLNKIRNTFEPKDRLEEKENKLTQFVKAIKTKKMSKHYLLFLGFETEEVEAPRQNNREISKMILMAYEFALSEFAQIFMLFTKDFDEDMDFQIDIKEFVNIISMLLQYKI